MTGYLINQEMRERYPQAVRGEGVYLLDADGRRYLDGCSGALVANLGHDTAGIARAMAAQADDLAYLYRYHFSSPAAERLAERFCRLTAEPMGRVYFTNSGSEATEAAVKVARCHHLAAGESGRYKVIARWQSYHGITLGALSWSGFCGRRSEYEPYLGAGAVHIAPPYCYRCWFGKEPAGCRLECARALETAILTEGPGTVSVFMAEPVAGTALAGLTPPAGYLEAVRGICDRYGVLYLAEEVMSGAGRTGGRYFASDHFPVRPDLIAFGKGAGAGVYPLAGVMASRRVAETIAGGSGEFAAGQSHAAHPMGMAAGAAVLDAMESRDLLRHAARMGDRLGRRLEALRRHPSVGDLRGMGLMRGVEFVRDAGTRETFDPARRFHLRVYRAAREAGLLVLPSGGCDRGRAGDTVLLGPPLVVNEAQVDELVEILDHALTRVERDEGL